MLYSGSLAIFLSVSIVDLSSSRTALRQSGATSGLPGLPRRYLESTWIPGGVAAAMVRSSIGFFLALLFVHDAQFFQNPIVNARPPGGGELSTVKVFVSPAPTVKSAHRMLLSVLGFGATPSGGLKLPGTNVPSEVSQPGITTSQSW